MILSSSDFHSQQLFGLYDLSERNQVGLMPTNLSVPVAVNCIDCFFFILSRKTNVLQTVLVVTIAGLCLKPEVENRVRNGRLNLHIAIPAPRRIMRTPDLVITIIAAILTTRVRGLGATPPTSVHDGRLVMWVPPRRLAVSCRLFC